MHGYESNTLKALEKIAEELELANRLKILEIASKHSSIKPENFLKFYDIAIELEEKIGIIEKH